MHDANLVRIVSRDRFHDEHFRRHLQLVDAGNDDLVQYGTTALCVPLGPTWHTVKPDEDVVFVNSSGT